MSLWQPRLEYFSLTRLISAYSRRTFRVVPGQLEAFGLRCSMWLWLWLWLAVAGCGRLWLWPWSWLWLWLDVALARTTKHSARPCHRESTVPDRATGSQPPHPPPCHRESTPPCCQNCWRLKVVDR